MKMLKLKTLLVVGLFSVGLVGCFEPDFSKPIYNLGSKVVIGEGLKGTVIDVRNWSGAMRGNTSDYYVMIGEGAAVWYDEEEVKRAN